MQFVLSAMSGDLLVRVQVYVGGHRRISTIGLRLALVIPESGATLKGRMLVCDMPPTQQPVNTCVKSHACCKAGGLILILIRKVRGFFLRWRAILDLF